MAPCLKPTRSIPSFPLEEVKHISYYTEQLLVENIARQELRKCGREGDGLFKVLPWADTDGKQTLSP